MCNDVIQINNEGERCWLNFMKWLENKDSTWIYRGVSDNEYLLLPSIGRLDYSLSKEMNLFSHFKRRGFQHIQGKDDVEWLACCTTSWFTNKIARLDDESSRCNFFRM